MFPFVGGRKKASEASGPAGAVVPKRKPKRPRDQNRNKTDVNIGANMDIETPLPRRTSERVGCEAENYEFGDQSVNDYSTSGQQMFEINQSSFALPFKKNPAKQSPGNGSGGSHKYVDGKGTVSKSSAKKLLTQSSEEKETIFRSKSECNLVPQEGEGDKEKMSFKESELEGSIAAWTIIDAAEDNDLKEVRMTLGKMPNMSRARAISIMKEKDFYQEYSPYDNEANGSTSNLDYTQGDTTDRGDDKLLDAIAEESLSPKPSPGLTRSTRMPVKKLELKGLWCEQDNVIKSGILDKLSEGEAKLQEALFEVITTEESNLKSLEILVSHFKASLEHPPSKPTKSSSGVALRASKEQERKGILSKYEANQLFFNIDMIKECSEKFLTIVEKKQGKNVLIQNYLDQFTEHVNSVLSKSIIKYCSNISHQREILATLTTNNVVFAEKIRQLEADPKLHDKTFKSFLLVPMTRICHLPLLIEKIVKVSGKLSDEYSVNINTSAKKAYEVVKDVASQCDQETRKLEDYAQQQSVLLNISNKLIIPLEIKLNLITASRTLLCECNATQDILPKPQVVESNSLFRSNQEINLNLKLFNDILLICKPAQDLFIVLDVADVRGGSVHISELTEENEADFLSRAKFLSASHRQKRPISLVFFRTKLGDYNQMKANETNPMGSNVDLRAINPNCFQDHAHVFVITPPEKRDQFVTKLRSCVVDKRISFDDEQERVVKLGRRKSSFISNDINLNNLMGGGTLGRRPSLKSTTGALFGDTTGIEQSVMSDTRGVIGSSSPNVDDITMQDAPKIVTTSSNAAFTPLLQRNTNLVRWTSSIQLSQSSQYEESTYEQDAQ